jgi:hypothetical protein
MAQNYKTGLIITGDASGGIRAIKATDNELGKLNQGFDRGSRRSRQFNQDVNATSQGLAVLKRAAAPIAGAIAGMFAANTLQNQIDWGDQLQKTNLRIGASTESLSQYNYVAKLSGVEFGQLTTAWQRQTRRIAEAAAGTSVATKALDRLGLSAKELNQLAPEEQFERIATAMQNVESSSERVALAQKLWDSEGVKLVQIVNQGTDAIAAMRAEADALGLTITQDTANAMATYNDEVDRLKFAAQGLSQTIAAEMVPSMTAGLQATSSFIHEIGGAETILDLTKDTATLLAGVLAGRLAGSLATSTAGMVAAQAQSIRYQATLASMAGVSRAAAASQIALGAASRGASAAMMLVGGPAGAAVLAGGAIYYFREELGLVTPKVQSATDRVDDMTSALDANSEAALKNAKAMLEAEQQFQQFRQTKLAMDVSRQRQIVAEEQRQWDAVGGHEAFGAGPSSESQQALQDLQIELMETRNAIEEAGGSVTEIDEKLAQLERTTRETIPPTTDLGDANETAAAKAKELAESTAAQAKALEDLYNRLRPGRRETIQMARDVSTLNLAMATGTGNIARHAQGMQLLALEYLNAQDKTKDLATASEDAGQSIARSFTTWGTIADNTIRDLDDTGRDAWLGLIDGSTSALDTVERAFEQTFANIAHMLTTQKLTFEVAGMMGLDTTGMPGGGGQSVGGFDLGSFNPSNLTSGIDTVGGWFKGGATAAPGGFTSQIGGTGSYSGWAGSATGTGYGPAASGGGWMSTAGSMAGTAAAAYGAYQIGSAIGDKISGLVTDKQAQSSWGQNIGAAGGFAIGGPVGAGIGSAIGSVVDSVFGSDSAVYKGKVATVDEAILSVETVTQKIAELGDAAAGEFFGITDTGSNLRKDLGRARNDSYFEGGNNEEYYEVGAFGAVGFKDRHTRDLGKGGEDGWWDEVTQGAAQVDNMVAALARGEDEFQAMKTAVQAVEIYSENAQDLVDAFTQTRPMAAIDAMTSEYGKFVQALDGSVEEIVTRAQQGASILAQAEGINDLIGDEVISRLQGISGSAEFDQMAAGLEQSVQAIALLMGSVDRLNLEFDETAAGALDAAGSIANYAGGVQNLSTLQSSYFDNYFSELERTQFAIEDVTAGFAALGTRLPKDEENLRALIEAQKLNTAAGQYNYAQLLQLSGAYKQLNDSMESQIDAVYQSSLGREAEAEGIDYWMDLVTAGAMTLEQALEGIRNSAEAAALAANGGATAVQDMSDAIRTREQLERQWLTLQGDTEALRERELAQLRNVAGAEEYGLEALQNRIWALEDSTARLADYERITGSIENAIDSMLVQYPGMADTRRTDALALLNNMADSGEIQQGPALDRALNAATQIDTRNYQSFEDYSRDFFRTNATLGRVRDVATAQEDRERELIEQIKNQSAEIKALRADMQASQTAIASQAQKTAKFLERFDIDGIKVRT